MQRTKTTKLFSFALTLFMLSTMIPLNASAEDDMAKTIIDVAQTDDGVNYYLTGDVSINTTSMETFEGSLDGRGHTVSTSVPLFDKVNGATIKNLTVTGNVTGYAAVANCVIGENKEISTSIFENITNKATVTNTQTTISKFIPSSSAVSAGGIVCVVYNTSANFIGCVNEGNVNSQKCVAGIASFISSCTVSILHCKNSGTITATGDIAGGIVAFINYSSIVTIEKSENANTVQGGSYIGGIVGSLSTSNNPYCSLSVTACKNVGAILATKTRAGGIVGYLKNYRSGYNISNCYNTASITANGIGECGGIVGCLAATTAADGNPLVYTVDGCYNSGTVTGVQAAQIYWTNSSNNEGLNYYRSDSNVNPYYYSSATVSGETAKSYTAEELSSGALAYTINADIGQEIYFQNINVGGETQDVHPVLDSQHGHIFKVDINEENSTYYSLVFYTIPSASIRLDSEHSGIRFSTAVSQADYSVLANAGISVSFVTRITPNDYLKAVDNDFFALADGEYLDVYSAATGTDVFREINGEDNSTYYYFCGSITDIRSDNYDWDYSAIGYVTIGETTRYSLDYVTRNIKYVATAAYYDTTTNYSEDDLEIIVGYIQGGDSAWIVDVPKYIGGTLKNIADVDTNIYELVYTDTSVEQFGTYCSSLETSGYTLYDRNEKNGNVYCSYFKSNSQLVYAYYTAYEKSVRIIVSPFNDGLLPLTFNSTEKVTEFSVTQLELDYSAQNGGGMSYIITLEDGSFIVIDGGTSTGTNVDHLHQKLQELNKRSGTPVIAAWYLTHVHQDHSNGFTAFATKYGSQYRLEYAIHNIPSKTVADLSPDGPMSSYYASGNYMNAVNAFVGEVKVVRVHTGMRINIHGAEFEVLYTWEDCFPNVLTTVNDSSVVMRMTLAGQTFLWTGDIQKQASSIIVSIWGDYVKSDYLQLAHHGWYNGGSWEFYRIIEPTVVFWSNHTTAFEDNYTSLTNPAGQLNRLGCIREHIVSGRGDRTLVVPYTVTVD